MSGWMPPRGGGYRPGVTTGPPRPRSLPVGPPPKGKPPVGQVLTEPQEGREQ